MATIEQPTLILNDLLAADSAAAWVHFDQLCATYARELRKLADEAAKKFRRHQWEKAPITAAGTPADWHLPDPDELINSTKAAGDLAAATKRVREKIAEASMGGTLAAYGINFDLRNPLIENVLTQMGTHISRIVEDQRRAIMESLQKSWQDGLSIRDATKAMLADSSIDSGIRAQMIARTELTGAANAGSLAATRLVNDASPSDSAMTKYWIATNDERTRESHSEASGQYGPGSGIALTDDFIVGGAALQHPGDPGGPPEEVINCRCSIGYEQTTSGQMAGPGVESVTPPMIPGTPQALAQDLVQAATKQEARTTRELQRIVTSHGGSMGGLDFRLKTEKSLAGKLARKAEQKKITPAAYAQEVADVLRYTGVFTPDQYVAGVERTLADLEKIGYKLNPTEVENYWQFGDDYNGINISLRNSKGYRFELQFHTPESLALKDETGPLHKLYEIFRDSKNPHERLRLWNEMVNLSDALPRPPGNLLDIGRIVTHEAPKLPESPTDLARSLISQASAVEPQVTESLQSIIGANGGELGGLDFRLKTQDSLSGKLLRKAEEKKMTPAEYSQAVGDVLRYTGVFSDRTYAQGVRDSIDRLRKEGYQIDHEKILNYWNYGDDYSGINIEVRTPGGYRFELQFHTVQSFELKNGELHRLYELFRGSTDPRVRLDLWHQMVNLSDAMPRPQGNVLHIGVETRHESPVAHGYDEVMLAASGPDIPAETDAWNALNSYTGVGYDQMNSVLRREELLNGRSVAEVMKDDTGDVPFSDKGQLLVYQRQIKMIDALFVPIKKTALLYRGYKKAVLGRGNLGKLVGKTITDEGFMSTTADREMALRFAREGASGSNRRADQQVIMEIVAEQGQPVLDVGRRMTAWDNAIHVDNHEREVLLPHGTRYRVESVHQDPQGRWIVRAVIVR